MIWPRNGRDLKERYIMCGYDEFDLYDCEKGIKVVEFCLKKLGISKKRLEEIKEEAKKIWYKEIEEEKL